MSVPMIPCPSCSTLLLEDTIECPSCRRVVRPDLKAQLHDERPAESLEADTAPEDVCGQCGETVRRGLVRCWNCGAFMRAEIAAAYQRMQESPAAVIYSPLPELDEETPSEPDRPDPEPTSIAEDDDFELSDEFETSPDVLVSEAVPVEPPPPAADPEPAPAAEANGVAELPSEPAPPPATDGPPADAQPAQPAAPAAEAPEVAHSVATGGDVLLKVALQEEAEVQRRRAAGHRRRARRASDGFLVYCPSGHRIEVQDRHRGLTGRCPRCKSPFFVPLKEETAAPQSEEAAAAADQQPAGPSAGRFTHWLQDVRLHMVNPTKLKLKPGSLEKAYQAVDLGFAADGLLMITLVKSGGLFGSAERKKPAVREALFAHLNEDKPLDALPVASHQFHPAQALGEIGVVQPAVYAHESMFAGLAVFGEGRIAARLPKTGDGADLPFLSFTLSEFRRFAAAMEELFGVRGLGEEQGVPLSDTLTELSCHYTDQKLQVLEHVEYYQADPQIKLDLLGRRCQGCGLVVSEDARKKERIGGASGRSIAGAKCPKCQQKFGNISLYGLPEPPKPAETPEPQAAATTGT